MSITISGLSSGLDVDAIIDGLVAAESAPLNRLATKKSDVQAASTTISGLSTKLSTLRSAANDLADLSHFASYAATSSDSAVVATVTGAAAPSAYDVKVTSIAAEQRTYSDAQTSSTDALGLGGTLSIQVGSGAAIDVNVTAGDSLSAIASKISSSGARVAASVVYDGSAYKLQVRGLDTGASNAITFGESGFSLGLSTLANTFQKASNAVIEVDGMTVSRANNQFVGVLPGVTLTVTKKTATPATVSVAADPDGLATKIGSFVKAYNDVINSAHTAIGFGTKTATNKELAGDSTIRSALEKVTRIIGSPVTGASGKYKTLTSVGLESNSDGTLKLDTTKLKSALAADSASVSRLFVVDAASGATGAMGSMKSVIDKLTSGSTSPLQARMDALSKTLTRIDTDSDAIQRRLDAYQTQLRAKFSALESIMTAQKGQLSALEKISSSSS